MVKIAIIDQNLYETLPAHRETRKGWHSTTAMQRNWVWLNNDLNKCRKVEEVEALLKDELEGKARKSFIKRINFRLRELANFDKKLARLEWLLAEELAGRGLYHNVRHRPRPCYIRMWEKRIKQRKSRR